MANKNGTLQEH